MRPTKRLAVSLAVVGGLCAREVSAEAPQKTPVTVTVVGHGSVRVVIADGASRPCEASDNHVLFSGHARAGEVIERVSRTGSVCVDHTYGAFRESQWAGASIWSGSGTGWSSARALEGSVSTDEP